MAPYATRSDAALLAHRVGHREHETIALHRRHQREPDAGVAAGRLDDRAARAERRPSRSAASIIARQMRSFTLPPRFSPPRAWPTPRYPSDFRDAPGAARPEFPDEIRAAIRPPGWESASWRRMSSAKAGMGLKLAPNRPGEDLIAVSRGARRSRSASSPPSPRLSAEGPVTLCARGGAAEVAALFPSEPRVVSLGRPEIAWLFAPLGSPTSGDDPGLAFLGRFARVRSFTGDTCAEMRERSLRHPGARVAAFHRRGAGDPDAMRATRSSATRWATTRAFAPGRAWAASSPSPSSPEPILRRASPAAARRLVVHPGSGGKRKRSARARAAQESMRAWLRPRGERRRGRPRSRRERRERHLGSTPGAWRCLGPRIVRSLAATLCCASCH